MPAPIRFDPLDASDPAALAALGRIYESSFPASERKPTTAVAEMARRPDYRLIAASARDGLTGFATVFAPPGEPFALLEYLAVHESARGAGIGAGLFRAAVEAIAEPEHAKSLLVEVEAALPADAPDHEQRRRRQAFYRRLGCRRIARLNYFLPLRSAGLPPSMHLFVHRPPTAAPLGRSELERAIRTIYVQVYEQPPDDPRISQMLALVPDPVEWE